MNNMQETNFVLLWQEHYQKIERALHINEILLRDSINTKARNSMRRLYRIKTVGIVAGIIFLGLLGIGLFFALKNYQSNKLYFIISIGAIFLINLKAVYDYIKHLHWASEIDYDGKIITIQQKLTQIKLSIINHCRIMVLQLPFWSTFFLDGSWFPFSTPAGFLVFQIFITGLLAVLSIWAFNNLKPEYANRFWIKQLLAGAGGNSVSKTLQLYQELKDFELPENPTTRENHGPENS